MTGQKWSSFRYILTQWRVHILPKIDNKMSEATSLWTYEPKASGWGWVVQGHRRFVGFSAQTKVRFAKQYSDLGLILSELQRNNASYGFEEKQRTKENTSTEDRFQHLRRIRIKGLFLKMYVFSTVLYESKTQLKFKSQKRISELFTRVSTNWPYSYIFTTE